MGDAPTLSEWAANLLPANVSYIRGLMVMHCSLISTLVISMICKCICGNTSIILTLNVWGPSYLGLTSSISWLLRPWLLTSPGHQQPWYWLRRICGSWSYMRKDFKYLCHINGEWWHKMQIYVYVPFEKFSTKRVNIWMVSSYLPCVGTCQISIWN